MYPEAPNGERSRYMPHEAAKRIRNVALVGHRGSGKTSLNEALLFQAGAINRLGSVADGTTVSDAAPDEKAREMSIAASLTSFHWDDRKINLIDTPGEPSFVADALSALTVCEGAVFVVNAVMGVEVGTMRLWERADKLGLARLIFVNMLDRERADFFRALDSLKSSFGPHAVATEIPIGSEHEVRGVIDLVDMKAYEYSGEEKENCKEIPIPDELQAQAEEYREKLLDEVAENSDELMERYLEGEEISHEETVTALKTGVTAGRLFPVTCGIATHNLAVNRLLDAIVEDLPSPGKVGAVQAGEATLEPRDDLDAVGFVFKTLADPYAGRINRFRVYQGVIAHDSHVVNLRAGAKERIGQLLEPQGKEMGHTDEFGPGDIGAVAKLKETHAGDVLAANEMDLTLELPKFPSPVMAFAIEPKADGVVAGFPLKGVKVTLFDGSYHSVDSSEQAFKVAGSMAFKDAAANASAVLLEPIMTVTLSVPEDSVGDVIGDLNSRRGRPLGMEPKGAMTEVKAEVPMSEMLSYAPDLRAITGGQGDYTMELARYEEIPAHLASKVISQASEESEAVKA